MSRSLTFVLAAAIMASAAHTATADQTGMAGMHEWRKEKGKTCMASHWHSGSGEGRTKRQARRAAIKAWQEFTAWEYGTSWARFSRAAQRRIGYSKQDNGWGATVEARPCLG